MATLHADPLATTEWLLIDGTNLLHALSKSTVAAPRSALIGRLRGAVPTSIAIDVVFDGPAERGLRGERIASGLRVRYSGGRTADAVLLSLVDETRVTDGPLGTAAILVVTDDRDLRHGLRLRGARTAGTRWLLGRLDRAGRSGNPKHASGAPMGQRPPGSRPPNAAGQPTADDGDGDDVPRWEPGRGATVKKGNPRRRPRTGSGGGQGGGV
jgi:predicted RNA-binding protein with PIN domain